MRAKSTLIVVACGTTAAALAYYYWWRRRPKRRWAHGVEVRQSRIPDAGDGLFAARRFEAGAVLGEYRGQVLSLLQAYKLEDRDYLMGGFGLNAHVDARFALDAPARYVNDNFDPTKLNARFEKNKEAKRALLLATRRIEAGEEVYASYGESYWRARGIDASTGKPLADKVSEPSPKVRRETGYRSFYGTLYK